jgi:hypothetical protein
VRRGGRRGDGSRVSLASHREMHAGGTVPGAFLRHSKTRGTVAGACKGNCPRCTFMVIWSACGGRRRGRDAGTVLASHPRVSPGDVRRKNRLLINSNYLYHPDFQLPVSDFRFSGIQGKVDTKTALSSHKGDVRRKSRPLINSNCLCHPGIRLLFFRLPLFSLRILTSGIRLLLF